VYTLLLVASHVARQSPPWARAVLPCIYVFTSAAVEQVLLLDLLRALLYNEAVVTPAPSLAVVPLLRQLLPPLGHQYGRDKSTDCTSPPMTVFRARH
jgi:hypothetical protein